MLQSISPVIIDKQILKPALWQLTLAAPGLAPAQPGQFYLAQCGDTMFAYLRRAIFPSFCSAEAEGRPPCLRLTLSAARLADPGLAWLAGRQLGESVNLVGPLGRGFSISPASRNLLLLGNGPVIEPLLGLAQQASQNRLNVVLAIEAVNAATIYPADRLPPAVELHLATLDGSFGHKGRILDHLGPLSQWADIICAVGSNDFYRDLAGRLKRERPLLEPGFVQVLLTGAPIHLCGVGVCTACTIYTPAGEKMVCHDGPVFDLATLQPEGD